jgi:hypothetical protein
MGVSVSSPDADDTVSVKIAGLTSYEFITDNADLTIFTGSSVILTEAEVNSGLTLHSTYGGTGHPGNTLTLTALNTTSGETISSSPQTITVTDPPPTLAANIALLAQYAASSGPTFGDGVGATLLTDLAAPQPLLAAWPHA